MVIWIIANNIIDIQSAFATMRSGSLSDVAAGIGELTSSTDFWLWFYLAFTISNTMIPSDTENLRGWWMIAGVIAMFVIAGLIIGVGSQLLTQVAVPLEDGINMLSTILGLMIGINLFMTLALGTLEAIIERITGDSATFRNGKMITMRREEVQAMREKERQRARQRERRSRSKDDDKGPPSIYKLPLPTPGAPGDIPVSQQPSRIVAPQSEGDDSASPQKSRKTPDMISGQSHPLQGGAATRRSLPAADEEDDNEEDTTDEEEEVASED